MSRHERDFVAFDLVREFLRRGPIDDPLTKGRDHRSGVRFGDPRLAGDLKAGEVQAHQVEASDPCPQRRMMASEDGADQVVEPPETALAVVAPRSGWVSLRQFLTIKAEPHDGQETPPSGHLMPRMVRKHLASSKRSWMFTMTRRPAGPIAAAARSFEKYDSTGAAPRTPHHPRIRHEPRRNGDGPCARTSARTGRDLGLPSRIRTG